MAWYADSSKVGKTTDEKNTPKYDKIWKPGEKPIYPGIYRCQSCGYEDVINRGCTKLPPCTNCEQKKHKDNTWKLLVRAADAK